MLEFFDFIMFLIVFSGSSFMPAWYLVPEFCASFIRKYNQDPMKHVRWRALEQQQSFLDVCWGLAATLDLIWLENVEVKKKRLNLW